MLVKKRSILTHFLPASALIPIFATLKTKTWQQQN